MRLGLGRFSACKLSQEAAQENAVRLAVLLEDALSRGLQGFAARPVRLAAPVGQLHQDAPPVVGSRVAPDELLILQLVDELRDVGLDASQFARKLLQRD